MDHLTVEELKHLLGRYPGWCVSLYMPTHRTGQDTEQDPIRFKNLLRDVEERLLAKNLRKPEVEGMLERAKALLNNPVFWHYGLWQYPLTGRTDPGAGAVG